MSQTGMQWDAADYARNATAQYAWAQSLLETLRLTGREAILDVGCGDGRITTEMSSGHFGRVVGVDSSLEMVLLAARRYALLPNLEFRQMDATALRYVGEFDLVFSNAALHWVADHPAVLAGIARALRPTGRVVLSMGGKGNAAGLLPVVDELIASRRWSEWFTGFVFPYAFYGVEEYEAWLPGTGLQATRLELVPKDMVHESVAALKGWIRTTWLPFTQRVPAALREGFIDELVGNYLERQPVDDAGRTHVKMIRLEFEAVKLA